MASKLPDTDEDLPAPVEDLPAPRRASVADLPAPVPAAAAPPGGGRGERPKRPLGMVDLPAPKRPADADLPAPKDASEADLLAPKRPADADLPAPKDASEADLLAPRGRSRPSAEALPSGTAASRAAETVTELLAPVEQLPAPAPAELAPKRASPTEVPSGVVDLLAPKASGAGRPAGAEASPVAGAPGLRLDADLPGLEALTDQPVPTTSVPAARRRPDPSPTAPATASRAVPTASAEPSMAPVSARWSPLAMGALGLGLAALAFAVGTRYAPPASLPPRAPTLVQAPGGPVPVLPTPVAPPPPPAAVVAEPAAPTPAPASASAPERPAPPPVAEAAAGGGPAAPSVDARQQGDERAAARAAEIPGTAQAYLRVARSLQARRGHLAEAREAYAKAAQLADALRFEARLGEASLLLEKDQVRDAAAAADALVREYPERSEPLLLLGDSRRAFDRRAAIRAYEGALRLEPRNARAHLGLAQALLDEDQSRAAAGHFDQALQAGIEVTEEVCELGRAIRPGVPCKPAPREHGAPAPTR